MKNFEQRFGKFQASLVHPSFTEVLLKTMHPRVQLEIDQIDMNLAFSTGSFRQCSKCESWKSYEDCQNNLEVQNCTDKSDGCFHINVKYWNASDIQYALSKRCVDAPKCEEYKPEEHWIL